MGQAVIISKSGMDDDVIQWADGTTTTTQVQITRKHDPYSVTIAIIRIRIGAQQ
jgi:hypothetical protein